jgi:NADH dehydrogenase [ubiquinone] 1 alpha subcomplex assembly factor 5
MAFTLAENERSGGVSQHTSPMITAVDFGNLFSRCGYNMPTIYADKIELLFDDAFQIMEFLQCIGENNALLNSRQDIQRELLLSVAAIYDSLFRSQRYPDKVYASFHIINFLGWKYHESQQKPKERGSAEFSLKVLQKEIEESGDPTEGKITAKSGTIEVDESDSEETSQEEKSKGDDNKGKK